MMYRKQEKWFKAAKVKSINNIEYQLCSLTEKKQHNSLVFGHSAKCPEGPCSRDSVPRHIFFSAPKVRDSEDFLPATC